MKIHKSALAALIATLCCGVATSTAFAGTPASAPTSNAAPAAVPQGHGDLSALIASGTLPDLRWPNFTDYRGDVKKFYDQGGNSLAWIQNGKASPQAVAMILLFQQAATKGLNPDDYDASRWDVRLAKLQPTAPKPSIATNMAGKSIVSSRRTSGDVAPLVMMLAAYFLSWDSSCLVRSLLV